MDVNLAMGAIAEGAGSPSGYAYSLGNLCPRCPQITKVNSGPQDLLLPKEVSLSIIRNHMVFIFEGRISIEYMQVKQIFRFTTKQ